MVYFDEDDNETMPLIPEVKTLLLVLLTLVLIALAITCYAYIIGELPFS